MTKLGVFALTLLFFSQTSTFGQIWIDGEKVVDVLDIIDVDDTGVIPYEFTGSADTADVVGWPPFWQNPFPFQFLPIYAGLFNQGGTIATANLGNYGILTNISNGYLGTVNTNGGQLANGFKGDGGSTDGGAGYVATLNVNGGSVYNGDGGTGYIDTANIYRGSVYNGASNSTGFITTAYVNGGLLFNGKVHGGDFGWVGTAFLNSGEIVNGGRIDNLTFTGGRYNGNYSTTAGTIGTLTLAGNSANNVDTLGYVGHWGIVENLQFADDGSGIMPVIAFADGSEIGFTPDIQPTNSVDLTYGNIVIDWTGIVSEGAQFSIFDLFDTTDVFGTLDSLTIGEKQFSRVGSDWTFTFADGVWSSSNAVPEPATLAIVGIGLAGLGLYRKRRK